MRKPGLFAFLILAGLLGGGYAGYATSGDFTGTSSMAGIALGASVLIWAIIAYHLDDQ